MRAAALLVLALLVAGCGGHGRAWQAERPGTADPASATLVAAEGAGAQRLTLYVARNDQRDICPGWSLGGRRPATFHCQRRGLERPVLWVQGGGGARNGVDWGGDVGLVAPGVTRVVVDERRVKLLPAHGVDGWRVFAVTHVAGSLDAYAGGTHLLEDDGVWINPDGLGCDCGRDASGWFGTFAYVPEQEHGDDARAIDLVLGTSAVRKLVEAHEAWIDMPIVWGRCVGGTIGQSVDIKLWKPATFRATLPFEKNEPAGRHVAYVSGEHRVLAIHSRELLAWVDTHAWRLAGVETNFDSGVTLPLGTTKKPQPGGGYDDPAACPKGD